MAYVRSGRRRARPGALGFGFSFEAEAEASTSGGASASATTTTSGGGAPPPTTAPGDPAVAIAAKRQEKAMCGPATYTVLPGDNTISVTRKFLSTADIADTLARASELILCNLARAPGPKNSFATLVPGEKLKLPKSWPALKPPVIIGIKKPLSLPPVLRTGFVKTTFTVPKARVAAEPGMSSGQRALLFAGMLAVFGGGMVLYAKRRKKAKK